MKKQIANRQAAPDLMQRMRARFEAFGARAALYGLPVAAASGLTGAAALSAVAVKSYADAVTEKFNQLRGTRGSK